MKVVVIGTGFGAHVMAPAYARAGFAATVVSPRDEAGIAAALDARPDLVSVHSPPFLHASHVSAALDRGIRVLCDKPFGLDAAAARTMRDRAEALGLPGFVNFELRFRPSRVKVGQLLAEGAIGALRHIQWTMLGDGLRAQPHGWLHDRSRGGGWLGAFGAHCIDAVCHWTGQGVARSGGLTRTDMPFRPGRDGALQRCTAEDAFSIWLELDDGVSVAIDSGFSTTVTVPERVLLLGDDGAIEMLIDECVILRRTGRQPETFDFTAPDGDGYAPALSAWLGAVRNALETGTAAAPDFSDGLANTEALDRLRAAVQRIDKE